MGILFVGAVQKSEGTADDQKAVVDALDFALAVGHGKPEDLRGEWRNLRNEQIGLRAYDMWITSLDDGSLSEGPWNHPDGTTYNADVWTYCRVRAEQFLRLCPEKLSNKLKLEFTGAAEVYGEVAAALLKVKALFPFGMSSDLPSSELVAETSKQLQKAKEAESRGLDLLASIRKML